MKTSQQHLFENHVPGKKLGKRAPRLDARTFKLSDYLKPTLPAPPAEVSWIMNVPQWGMMLNDTLGDCTCACAGHMIEQQTRYASGTETIISDNAILKAYEDVGGYVPGNPNSDNGAVIVDVLNYWRQTGIGGHKILAWATVDVTNLTQLKTAVQLFGSVYIGIQLPISCQGQNAWTVPNGGAYGDGSPGSWGGHAIPIMAYSPETLSVITWGSRLKMSYNFMHDYVDEAYVVISNDWIEKTGLSPSGFDLVQLQQDLSAL